MLFFISSALSPASWCSHRISIVGSNLCLHVTAIYSPPASPHKTKCLWAVGQYLTLKGIMQHGPLASLHSCDLFGFAFPRQSWRSKSNVSVPLLRLRAISRSSWRMRMWIGTRPYSSTKMVIQAIGEICSHVGRGALAIVTNADLLFRTGGLSSLLLLGFFTTHAASRVVGGQLSDGWALPELVSLLVCRPSHRGVSIFF